MTTRMRLVIGSVIILSATAYTAWLGASSSWQYYVTVDECVRNASTLLHTPVRVSGTIAANSLRVGSEREDTVFVLRGERCSMHVRCPGRMPDNLTEDRQVVVEGRLYDSGQLIGDRVLTRCASKYSSKSISDDSTSIVSGSSP